MEKVSLKRESLTHRKEAAIPTLWSGTIKGRTESRLGVKRTNGAQRKEDWAEQRPFNRN